MTPKPPDNPSISTIHRESERAILTARRQRPTNPYGSNRRPVKATNAAPLRAASSSAERRRAPSASAPRRRRERDIGEPTPPWQEMILTDRSQDPCSPVTPRPPARTTPPTRAPHAARTRDRPPPANRSGETGAGNRHTRPNRQSGARKAAPPLSALRIAPNGGGSRVLGLSRRVIGRV